MMANLENPLPSYLIRKKNIISLILFTSVFALVFINIYSPFGSDRWYGTSRFEFFTYSSLTILTGVLVVVISRMLMYHYCKRHILKIRQYLLWILGEILFMSLFYALFGKFVLDDGRMFEELYKSSVWNTAMVLLLPYTISWLWLAWQDKKEQLARISEGEQPGSQREMIPFYDDKGILKFSVKKDNLLYLESAENYVSICYLNKEKLSRFLLRDTLKRMEESFSGSEIVRCHRCYMVNFQKVRVIRKDKDGLKLELDAEEAADIPVSKTYVGSVMQTFSKYYAAGDAGN